MLIYKTCVRHSTPSRRLLPSICLEQTWRGPVALRRFVTSTAAPLSPTSLPQDIGSGTDCPRPSDVFSGFSSRLFRLSSETLSALETVFPDIQIPTETQVRSIPLTREGKNLFVLSRTGTGKTLAFLLPTVEAVSRRRGVTEHSSGDRLPGPPSLLSALILCPSRELALQTSGVLKRLLIFHPIRHAVCVGGAPLSTSVDALLQSQPHILVATPGRLSRVLHQMSEEGRASYLQRVQHVVVDEGDKMCQSILSVDLSRILAEVLKAQVPATSREDSLPSPSLLPISRPPSDPTSPLSQEDSSAPPFQLSLYGATFDSRIRRSVKRLFQSCQEDASLPSVTFDLRLLDGASGAHDGEVLSIRTHAVPPRGGGGAGPKERVQEEEEVLLLETAQRADQKWVEVTGRNLIETLTRILLRSSGVGIRGETSPNNFQEMTQEGLSQSSNGTPLPELAKKILVFLPTSHMTQLLYILATRFLFPQMAETTKEGNLLSTQTFCIHRGISQKSRDFIRSRFSEASSGILFATDVAARGLDFENVDLIVQMNLGGACEVEYVHRVGRTARGGKPGKALLLLLRNVDDQVIPTLEKGGLKVEPLGGEEERRGGRRTGKAEGEVWGSHALEEKEEFWQMIQDCVEESREVIQCKRQDRLRKKRQRESAEIEATPLDHTMIESPANEEHQKRSGGRVEHATFSGGVNVENGTFQVSERRADLEGPENLEEREKASPVCAWSTLRQARWRKNRKLFHLSALCLSSLIAHHHSVCQTLVNRSQQTNGGDSTGSEMLDRPGAVDKDDHPPPGSRMEVERQKDEMRGLMSARVHVVADLMISLGLLRPELPPVGPKFINSRGFWLDRNMQTVAGLRASTWRSFVRELESLDPHRVPPLPSPFTESPQCTADGLFSSGVSQDEKRRVSVEEEICRVSRLAEGCEGNQTAADSENLERLGGLDSRDEGRPFDLAGFRRSLSISPLTGFPESASVPFDHSSTPPSPPASIRSSMTLAEALRIDGLVLDTAEASLESLLNSSSPSAEMQLHSGPEAAESCLSTRRDDRQRRTSGRKRLPNLRARLPEMITGDGLHFNCAPGSENVGHGSRDDLSVTYKGIQ
uniref:ATP-dependent RNA helicase n=1 Tax=Chromera velia CCMP2878 TaxID=1169474 RepID=A0A0G4IG40_9ALVE|eukprot:Cvel_14109.t1-p1 / transcript=Cvel_14109.t1 / gene=Cvel_14109 / organism=Chromera_velia_CCMP2878 / gene_product=DEAD-box ATP-dependent RNA helicase 25, putative / transcript_product=DEAD-box ATP-dependent RNA helicase 25, putative / location=Cvel_scaffold993:17793-23250(+) / protein_length=1100 / sequence_SO=supercontig / SO=protein_coding / is_pseudo=false